MTEPRLLFIGHGAERTGPPLFLLRLLHWAEANGRRRPMLIVARDGELVPDYRRLADVTVASRGAEPLEPLAAALRRIGATHWAGAAGDRWLRARLGRTPPADVIHVNGCSPANARVLAALGPSPAPVVLHVHELDIGLTHNLSSAQRRLLLGRADRFLAVAEAVAENLTAHHGISPDRISIHPGFIDADAPVGTAAEGREVRRELGLADDAFVVGTVALPDWRKAPDLLLRAAWTVRRLRPDIDLHVVWLGGDPLSVDGWQAGHEAAQLGLAGRFHQLAHRPDPKPVTAALDVYVSSAREDAFPLAVLEAAAGSCPTITFASGGTQEFVGDDAGVVVPWPDTDQMAAAIIAFHDEPSRRRAAGDVARARVADAFSTSVRAPVLWNALVAAGSTRVPGSGGTHR